MREKLINFFLREKLIFEEVAIIINNNTIVYTII